MSKTSKDRAPPKTITQIVSQAVATDVVLTMSEHDNPLWVAAYCPSFEATKNDSSVSVEVPRYRVVPAGNADRWIAETNTEMSRDVQEKCARAIAETLSNFFGV